MLGTITTTLRPLKFAFLVHPKDRDGLYKAIELNTILWGGQFNPIIPTYLQLPTAWKKGEGLKSAKDVFTGYLEAYDPDYVVPIGRIVESPFPAGPRKVLSRQAVIGEFEESGQLGYGIGLFEILSYFIKEELRFTRRFPIKIVFPEIPKQHSLFFSSVFGALPENAESVLREQWSKPLDACWRLCTKHSYAELLDKKVLFPRRLSTLFVGEKIGSRRRDCVFVMDATRIVDIIDYWNLRAAGWNVLPVPVQFSKHPSVQNFVREFIDDNFFQSSQNSAIYNKTTILNSKNVTNEKIITFINSLGIIPKKKASESKFTLQQWYPRIWDSWARRHDHVDTWSLEADSRSIDLPEDRRRLRLKTLDPKFMLRFRGASKKAFANIINMKFYGARDLVAEVIPEGDDTLSRAFRGMGPDECRFSRSGITYLSSYSDWSIHLDVPDAESVFVEWFRQYGWSVTLSSAGRIAKQVCLALKGVLGAHILTYEGIVKLLNEMSGGKTKLKQEFTGKLSLVSNQDRFQVPAERLLQNLTNLRMVRLGVKVQCPVCIQHSWYSLEDLDYKLQCMKCLEKFDVPSHSPDELAWCYRSFGPFNLPEYAHGAYSVLLTYYFFSRKLDAATTAIMSFCAESDRGKLEADLGIFFGEDWSGRSSTALLFAECKSYGRFEPHDLERMTCLGAEFPGAILVFSTLRRDLTLNEKRMLKRVANRGRKYSAHDPNHNPVLMLTGVELFGHERPPYCWEDEGGKFSAFAENERPYRGILELCDYTQQLHLDMESYGEWLDNQFECHITPR